MRKHEVYLKSRMRLVDFSLQQDRQTARGMLGIIIKLENNREMLP